jgi:SAM-dependent MidA family methyltransferase
MGIHVRLAQMAKRCADSQRGGIFLAAKRLIDTSPNGMGIRYKVLAMTSGRSGKDVYPFRGQEATSDGCPVNRDGDET